MVDTEDHAAAAETARAAAQRQNLSGYKVFGVAIPAWRSPLMQGISTYWHLNEC